MYFFNILLLFLILLFNNKLIQTYLKILKYKNIKHLSSKPTLGGFIIISNLFLYFLVSKDNLSEFFTLDYHFYIFCFSMLIIFVTGFYDDLFSLDPLKRILIISLILFFFLSAVEYFQLYKLNFTYINYSINIQNISIFFTILCFIILININNMFDGINGQSGLYFIQIVLFFFYKNFDHSLIYILLLSLIVFLILNFKNKIYMGDSGIYLLSFVFGVMFISGYFSKKISIEDILVLSSVPLLDFIRLFIIRLYSSKNPISGDKNHIHHICALKYGKINTIILIQLNIFIPIVLNQLYNFYFAILFSIVFYFILINNRLKIRL